MARHKASIAGLGFQRLAGVCGVFGAALPLALVLAATFLSEWFSWSENALSELGFGSQTMLFNGAMWLGGALNLIFSCGLYLSFEGERLMRAGAVLLMSSSVSLTLVGVFTVEYILLHGVAAFGFFVLAPLGFILVGFGAKDEKIKKLSFTCGIFALLAILVLPFATVALRVKLGFAVPELIEALAISAWTIYMATWLYRNASHKQKINE